MPIRVARVHGGSMEIPLIDCGLVIVFDTSAL
jgi:hypothetical protein